jgi:hypothetical protein
VSAAAKVLERARAADVRLEVRRERLTYDAPVDVAPEVLVNLRQHKIEILELLSSRAVRPSPWTDESIEACTRMQGLVPDELGKPRYPERELEAWLRSRTPCDDAAHAAMHRDLQTVVQDLANEGKRPGQIARMFGLKPVEVRQILRTKPRPCDSRQP